MALRRAISLSTTLLRHRHHYRTLSTAANTISTLFTTATTTTNHRAEVNFRCFHSSHLLSRQFDDVDKINPDDILFEGCDYKHWLIVMDFPSDPQQRPPSHQMVDTYVETLAKVVGSVEEAKKRMYACSTTTYTGFQAEMDEETSKKFEGMPGVLFVLPDSYIDPVNKEYGGDKYINGTIIPRPPPVQYGRVRRGNRYNNQSPRGQMPNQEQNPAYNQPPADGRGYPPQQRFPRQNFPPQQGLPPQQGFPPQHGHPPQRGFPQQQGVPPQQDFPPQQGVPSQQGFPPQQNYGPPGQGVRDNYVNTGAHDPAGGRNTYPGGGNNYMPSHQGNYNQGYNNPQRPVDNHAEDRMGYAPQGQTRLSGHNRSHDSPFPERGPYGPPGFGSSGQGEAGQYATPRNGSYGQGTQSGYGPGYGPRGESQAFAQTPDEHSNTMSTEHRNYSPTGYGRIN